jgi:hypothetical protein
MGWISIKTQQDIYLMFKSLTAYVIQRDLNSGLRVSKPGTLQLEPHLQSIYSGFSGYGISQMICSAWPRTLILPISASKVARITGMSHCT